VDGNADTDAQECSPLQNVPSGVGAISVQVLEGLTSEYAITVAEGGTTNVLVKGSMHWGISGHALDSAGKSTAGTIVLTGRNIPYYLTSRGPTALFSCRKCWLGIHAKPERAYWNFTLYGDKTGSVLRVKPPHQRSGCNPAGPLPALVLRAGRRGLLPWVRPSRCTLIWFLSRFRQETTKVYCGRASLGAFMSTSPIHHDGNSCDFGPVPDL